MAGYMNLVNETNNLRARTQSSVSCEHNRYDICNKCLDHVTGYSTGDHKLTPTHDESLALTRQQIMFRGFINRGRDVMPNTEVKTTCSCGDVDNHLC